MTDDEKKQQELEDAAKDLEAAETAKAEEVKAEAELQEATEDRLHKTFVTGEKLEQPEPSEKSDDSTLDEGSADEDDDKGGPTAAEKKEEAKLEAEAKAKAGEEKDDTDDKSVSDTDSEAKDEDSEKGKDKKKDTPPLSDAYVRAAIHRNWTEEDIKEQYAANPELTVRTLGKVYEEVNRASQEFAAIGRARIKAETEPAAQPKEESEKKSEFKGVDIEALKRTDVDPDVIEIMKAMDQQNKLQFDELQELKVSRSASATGQPSGLSEEQTQAINQKAAAIEQQIETFFKADTLKGYEDFYGELPKDATDWKGLTPGQQMNRWTVIEMADQMTVGASALGREMKTDEALNLAHLSVTENIREKVIREGIMAKVEKRSGNLSLKPSGTAQSGQTQPQTKQELEDVTAARLAKMKW